MKMYDINHVFFLLLFTFYEKIFREGIGEETLYSILI